MAHPCCACGSECYCHGDIDDVVVSKTPKNCDTCGCSEDDDRDFLDDYDEWDEFYPCDQCDGHDACADFGCAVELGKGNMIRKNIEPGNDDWG